MEIRWSVKDEKVNFVNCLISVNVNSDEFEIEKATINGEDVQVKEILELARQNKDVLMEGEPLHEFLEGYLEQDVQSQKEEIVTLGAAVPVPSVSFSFDSLKPGELEAGCIGGGYDDHLILYHSSHPPRSRLYQSYAEEKLHPDYREWDR